MRENWFQLASVMIAFLTIFATGFWLARAGRPYGMGLITLHKIVALAVLVFLGISTYQSNKAVALGSELWLMVGLAVLAFVAAIASGGVLSATDKPPAFAAPIHRFAPYVAALLTLAAFYLLQY